MCCHLATKYSSLRIGPTEESVLTLPLLTHPCAALLSTYVWICAKGNILGAKSRIFMSSAPSSSVFIVTSHLRLEEDIRHAWVVRENRERQTKYFPSGYQHNPPIPDPDASAVPIQVGAKGSNLRR